MKLEVQPQQRVRFYDGGTDEIPPRPGDEPQILLERTVSEEDGKWEETFRLLRRVAYRDDEYGEILVPRDIDGFTTDFASVPALLTWLVPKSGRHLPAALVHDGLVHAPGTPDYLSTEGHVIDRVGADRVFRAAMRDSGVGFVRRWLVWSAVTLGTIWGGSTDWSPARHWRYRAAMMGTLLVVFALGVLASVDLVDGQVLGRPVELWWMGEAPWWVELATGLAGAVVIPLALCAAWGRFFVAGAVSGIALAFLLHALVLVVAVTGLYWAAEWLARRPPWGAVTAVAAVTTATVVWLAALLL